MIEKEKVHEDLLFKSFTEQIRNAFTFCREAMNALEKGSIQTQRDILCYFGSNQQLNQKILCVDVFGWFLAIKKCEKLYTSESGRFELEKANNDKAQNENQAFFPLKRALAEHVRTEFAKADEAGNVIIVPDLSGWTKNYQS